jgi:hypothetical protein
MPKDYGSDPLGDGTFRMVPSGDIVSLAERNKRLADSQHPHPRNDCFGLSWEQLALKQGGLHTLDCTRRKRQ